MFNSEGSKELHELAFNGIRLYFPGFIFAGFNIVATGYLSASDCALQALATSFSRGVIAIIPLSRILGMRGIWSSFMAAEMLTTIMIMIMLVYLNKRRK